MKNITTRLVSAALAVSMMLSVCPVSAFAAVRQTGAEKAAAAYAAQHPEAKNVDQQNDGDNEIYEDKHSYNTVYINKFTGLPCENGEEDKSADYDFIYKNYKKVNGEGWTYDVVNEELTIKGKRTIFSLPGESEVKCDIVLDGGTTMNATGGVFTGEITVQNGGALPDGGTFTNTITWDNGTINSGVFSDLEKIGKTDEKLIPVTYEGDNSSAVKIGCTQPTKAIGSIKNGRSYWKYSIISKLCIRLPDSSAVKSINGKYINLDELSEGKGTIDGAAIRWDGTYLYFDNVPASQKVELNSKAPEPEPGEEISSGSSGADAGGAIAAAALTAGAAWAGYELGVHLYQKYNMGLAYWPENRLGLAKAVWEKAGKPAPESTALYADIDADDADAQKAARWCVEDRKGECGRRL